MANKVNFSKEQLNQMMFMHNEGKSNKEIAKKFNTSTSTIVRKLRSMGIPSSHPSLSEERIKQAIELYGQLKSIQAVSKRLYMGEVTVKDILLKNNIYILNRSEVKKTCYINEDYFETIDTHRKAYYLGLLCADGTIGKNNNKVAISL